MNINKYLNEIEQFGFLTKEEEYALFEKYYEGDNNAFEQLVKSSLLSVYIICKEFKKLYPSLDMFDLISEGNLALVKAVKAFKTSSGNRLYTLVITAVKNTLITFIKYNNTVKLPTKRDGIGYSLEEITDFKNAFANPDEFEIDDNKNEFYYHLNKLDEKEIELLINLYGLYGYKELSITEYAEKIGVSTTTVRDRKRKIIDKMMKIDYFK